MFLTSVARGANIMRVTSHKRGVTSSKYIIGVFSLCNNIQSESTPTNTATAEDCERLISLLEPLSSVHRALVVRSIENYYNLTCGQPVKRCVHIYRVRKRNRSARILGDLSRSPNVAVREMEEAMFE